jgi:carotenoid cleavage dioxygenase-like enzyme
MMCFGYSPVMAPYLVHSMVDARGAIVKTTPIELEKAALLHDWAITRRFSIFFELPVSFDLGRAMASNSPFIWDPARSARIGVLPRHGEGSEIRWFDVGSCYVLHVANAYEDGAEIVVDACRSNIGDFPTEQDERLGTDDDRAEKLHRWRLNLETGAVTQERVDRFAIDFPRINERYVGRKNRFIYATRLAPPETAVHPRLAEFRKKWRGSLIFDGIIQYDRDGKRSLFHSLGPNRYLAGEAVFAPRPGGTEEDDGWVIAFVRDEAAERSECVVIDARRFTADPVARIHIPARVPYGFHSAWVAREAFSS